MLLFSSEENQTLKNKKQKQFWWRCKYQTISFWNINHVTVLYSNKSWEPLIKGTPVHIGIGQEFSQFIALSVVVHHTKAFVTEETWVTRSKLVVGGIPSRKTRYVISL